MIKELHSKGCFRPVKRVEYREWFPTSQVSWRFILGTRILARHWWTVVHHPEMAGWCTMALQETACFVPRPGRKIYQFSFRPQDRWKKGNTTRSQANKHLVRLYRRVFFTRLWTRPSFCFRFFIPNYSFPSIFHSANFLLWPSCEQTQCCNLKFYAGRKWGCGKIPHLHLSTECFDEVPQLVE